jgi:PilZ domain-containing protein
MTKPKTAADELRRVQRFRACCRVDVRQRYCAWSAVTDELSARGCRLLTRQLPRLGSTLDMTLSTDLFSDDLETEGEVVWIESGRMGVRFRDRREQLRGRLLAAPDWVEKVLARGWSPGPGGEHIVPAIIETAPGGAGRRIVVPIEEAAAHARSRLRATRSS